MCRGCFNQLFLRDEFLSGGMAGLFGKAAGMPTRRAFMAYSVGAASALTAVGTAPAFAAGEGADVILRGGTIRPLPGAPVSSALAIKGGKVLAVGDESALAGLKTGYTKVVELDGRTLLPGLIDPHCHTLLASLIFELLDDIGYAKYPTREKVIAHLKEVAAQHAERAMDRRLQFRQSSARRGFHAGGTGCDFNRPSDFRLVHQWARRLRQQRSA